MKKLALRCLLVSTGVCVLAGSSAGPASAGGSATATCRGSEAFCEATFSLAGGARNKRLTVNLPGTDLRFLRSNATPGQVHGAYFLSGGRFQLGGSQYVVTLGAVDSIPSGAKLTLSFGHPMAALRCGNAGDISHITVHAISASFSQSALRCSRAQAVGRTWLSQFRRHQAVNRVTTNDVRYSCKLVAVMPQNIQCDGDGTRVRFAGPTG
jgi:hypothetical protein